MVDLVMKINQCSFAEAMKKLDKNPNSFSFHGKQSSAESNIHITNILALTNGALLGYLAERKINLETARRRLCEVHYTVGGKAYFAIGFDNDKGGYELRNRYFKGCISPKYITTINRDTDTCVVFEGFMDYLSYLTLKQHACPQTDMVILNSVILLDKAMDFLKRHSAIHTFLDNDEAGKQTLAKIQSTCKNVIDQSGYYKNHKDLNALLCEKPEVKQASNKPKFKMKR